MFTGSRLVHFPLFPCHSHIQNSLLGSKFINTDPFKNLRMLFNIFSKVLESHHLSQASCLIPQVIPQSFFAKGIVIVIVLLLFLGHSDKTNYDIIKLHYRSCREIETWQEMFTTANSAAAAATAYMLFHRRQRQSLEETTGHDWLTLFICLSVLPESKSAPRGVFSPSSYGTVNCPAASLG